jgi:alpha-amylase
MARALAAAGVRLHADAVLNHMANESARRSDLDYPGQRVLALYAADSQRTTQLRLFGDTSRNLFGASDFNPAQCIVDYNNPAQVQNGRLCAGGGDPGLPDLAPSDHVVAEQQQYLRALRALGVTGFRVDAAKHMPYAHVRRVFAADVVGDAFVYGEIITGGGSGNNEYALYLQPWMSDTTFAAYDFPLHNTLRRAFAIGGDLGLLADPLSGGQALPGARAVTFAVTHDMPLNGIFRDLILDRTDETLAYAWLIGRGEGQPLVYSDNAESGEKFWRNAWKRRDISQMIGFHNALRGDDYAVLARGTCHLVFRRGARGLGAINKCANAVTVDINLAGTPLREGASYRNQLGSGAVTPSATRLRLELAPRSAALWLAAD